MPRPLANSGRPQWRGAWRYSTAIAAAVGNHSGVKWLASLDSDRLSKASRNVASATNRECVSTTPLWVPNVFGALISIDTLTDGLCQ